jgi:hypothetical protein
VNAKNGRSSRSTLRFTLKAARIEALSDFVLRKVLGAQTHERAPFLPDWTKIWGYAPGGGLRPKNAEIWFPESLIIGGVLVNAKTGEAVTVLCASL